MLYAYRLSLLINLCLDVQKTPERGQALDLPARAPHQPLVLVPAFQSDLKVRLFWEGSLPVENVARLNLHADIAD